MTQINFTLNQEEILEFFTKDREDALRIIVEKILNQIMLAESNEQLGACRHERTEVRTDYRNGTRERQLTTRIGTITLEVPRHRNQPFHTLIFDNYSRSEASLIATMVELVVNGVSTRRISKCVETLCGKG
ncbi:transposase-like protein, partial [Clostridiales Family XIII bacterium PM5-7]